MVCLLAFSNAIFAQEQIFEVKQWLMYDEEKDDFDLWDADVQNGFEFYINPAQSKIIINYPDGSQRKEEYKIYTSQKMDGGVTRYSY